MPNPNIGEADVAEQAQAASGAVTEAARRRALLESLADTSPAASYWLPGEARFVKRVTAAGKYWEYCAATNEIRPCGPTPGAWERLTGIAFTNATLS